MVFKKTITIAIVAIFCISALAFIFCYGNGIAIDRVFKILISRSTRRDSRTKCSGGKSAKPSRCE